MFNRVKQIVNDKLWQIVENLEKKELEEKGVQIAEPGKFWNTRFEYAEVQGFGVSYFNGEPIHQEGGLKKSEDLVLRHGRYIHPFVWSEQYLTVAERGKMTVVSKLGDFDCDLILRDNPTSPLWGDCDHMYFLNKEFTGYLREFTPSMMGGTPKDRRVDYEKIRNKVEWSIPLIRRMELELGRELVKRV